MAITLHVFTIGGGELLENVLNAVATVFNDPVGIGAVTSLALMVGGICAVFEFGKSQDLQVLVRWMGLYILATSLILYPKSTVSIEDRTGFDLKPRIVDNVPLALGMFASTTSRIGIGLTELIETVFHLPDDVSYSKTGMVMGSKLVIAAKNFQITDAGFNETLNDFMQQCVFYDLLLKKYTIQDLVHANQPWEFIAAHTSRARAFSLQGETTVCNTGAAKLKTAWDKAIRDAATLYGGQILSASRNPDKMLLSRLSDGYQFLTSVSAKGEDILKTNLLANALSNAVAHYGANANAPAALQAYEDTKAEMQARETMDQTGRQAGVWMQYFKNIIEAVLYAAFIFIYFFSYFPFGVAIIRNYLLGLFVLQALAPLYAIINFAANILAQNRSSAFLATDPVLSIANIAGITQANADAVAVAGYLIWPVTLGGALMLFRGLPSAIQSMGQYVGGVVQHAGSHVAAEAVGGNISAGNANFGNRSFSNLTANHWDSNARYAGGAATLQTGTGSSLTITPGGSEVLDNRGGTSNLGVSVHVAESIRSVAAHQRQSGITASLSNIHAEGEQYSAAFRKIHDYAHQQGHSTASSESHGETQTSGFSQSAHQVSQLIENWAKEHHVSHERAAQIFGQVYAELKGGFEVFGNGGHVGAQASLTGSGRSAFGGLYSDAHRYAKDHNFAKTVDSAQREAIESNYRDSKDQGDRSAQSIATSFDQAENYRKEAISQLAKAESYSALASLSQEEATSINENYTQAFFRWMRHQPSPASRYGQGTFSNSAIDEMAINEPGQLHDYADRFVREKTAEAMHKFEQTHHLTNGTQAVQGTYARNNQQVDKRHEAILEDQSTLQPTRTQLNEIGFNDIGIVDAGIKDKVDQSMKKNTDKLTQEQSDIDGEAGPLQERIKDKVKGQILGSLGTPDPLSKTMTGKKKVELLMPFLEKQLKDD